MLNASLDPSASMPKHVYCELYLCIMKTLEEDDEEWDEAEAKRLTAEGWQEDARGADAMTRSMFNDSLFECARRISMTGLIATLCEYEPAVARLLLPAGSRTCGH